MILLLFAASAVVLHRPPTVKGATNPVSLFGLPMTLGAWSGAEGAPVEILPVDPNEKLSVRRTYRKGGQLAWVSVALFVGQDVEFTCLDARLIVEKAWVEVDGHNLSRRPDAVAQPTRDRATTRADVEAPPSRSNPLTRPLPFLR